jgi:hypothetical protein
MDNQWGDYRYPASDELIGPEAPRLGFRAEPAENSTPAWEAKELNDDDWQSVTCTFGPYWHVLDPVAVRLDSDELRQKVVSAISGTTRPIEVDGKSLNWQPYVYSWSLGADRADVHQAGTDGLGPVSPNFLVFDPNRRIPAAVRYLTTRVFSPGEQTLNFDFGGSAKSPERQAWINGEAVFDVKANTPLAPVRVTLRSGWNHVVLRLVQTGARPHATFAVFHDSPTTPEQPRFMPLSRWHDVQPVLVYDCRAEGEESIGWYRFKAPPGTKQARLNLVAQSVEAWVDGQSVDVADDTIEFPAASQAATEATTVALRVRHKLGRYEGAAFRAPVSFTCGRGQLSLGDWSQSGLEYYSGGVKYVRHVTLSEVRESDDVLLDLGDVRTSAEVTVNGQPIGVRLAPPFVFDVTEAVHPGDNKIEVEVLNTLANYMSAGHTKYVYKGQTVSGLLGPVTLRTLPRIQIECRPVGATDGRAVGGAE